MPEIMCSLPLEGYFVMGPHSESLPRAGTYTMLAGGEREVE